MSNEKSNDDYDNKTNNSINVGFRETTINDVEMKVYFRKYRMQILIPSFTMMIFLAFAFFISSMIVLSIIPLYLGDISVAKTSFIQTSRIDLFDYEQKIFVLAVQISNFTLSMSQSIGKRDLSRLAFVTNTTGFVTLNQGQMAMNSSIQYAVSSQDSNSNQF